MLLLGQKPSVLGFNTRGPPLASLSHTLGAALYIGSDTPAAVNDAPAVATVNDNKKMLFLY